MARAGRRKTGEPFSSLLADYERDPQNARRLHGSDKPRPERAFGRRRLRDITEKSVTDYGLAREAAGAVSAIINDELRTRGTHRRVHGQETAGAAVNAAPRGAVERKT